MRVFGNKLVQENEELRNFLIEHRMTDDVMRNRRIVRNMSHRKRVAYLKRLVKLVLAANYPSRQPR